MVQTFSILLKRARTAKMAKALEKMSLEELQAHQESEVEAALKRL